MTKKDGLSAESEGIPLNPDGSNVTLKMLKILVKVAENDLGIRAVLGESQEQQGSKALKALKEAFHCPILNHKIRPARLTSEGHELAKIARKYLSELENFRRKQLKLPTKVRIAGGENLLNWIVLPSINKFLFQEKSVMFSIREGGAEKLVTLLQEGETDFIVVPDHVRLDSSWRCENIGVYQFCLCCPIGSLERINKETVNELEKEAIEGLNFALMKEHWNMDFLESAANAGIELKVGVRCQNFTQVAVLIKTGLFAGILPRSAMSDFDRLSFKSFKPKFIENTDKKINLVWNPKEENNRECLDGLALPLLEKLRQELSTAQHLEPSS